MTLTCGMQNVGGLVLPSSEATELKESLTYNVVYENLLYCLFVFLGPLLVLIVLNACLIQVYIISNQLESALCGDANPRRLQRQSCCG